MDLACCARGQQVLLGAAAFEAVEGASYFCWVSWLEIFGAQHPSSWAVLGRGVKSFIILTACG